MILVVEDEFLVNWTTTDELRSSGHEVVSAFSADEAIQILESHPEIRVVFTDIDMPGSIDGLKLAAAVRDRWPPIQVIVTSGKTTPSGLPDKVDFVAKPYTANSLLRMISAY